MAFVLSDSNDFETKVEVATPYERGVVNWSFMAKFRIITEADVKNDQGNIIEHGLLSVSEFKGLELPKDASADELLRLVKTRPDTKGAITRTYRAEVEKKNLGNSFLM